MTLSSQVNGAISQGKRVQVMKGVYELSDACEYGVRKCLQRTGLSVSSIVFSCSV